MFGLINYSLVLQVTSIFFNIKRIFLCCQIILRFCSQYACRVLFVSN